MKISILFILLTFICLSEATDLPGGRPDDIALAIHNPHEYAWRLFLSVNIQAADRSAGVPDAGKTIRDYDADKPVIWETWALASGGRAGGRRSIPNRSEVYLDKGAKPVPWDQLPRGESSKPLEPLGSKRLEFLATKEEVQPQTALVAVDLFPRERRTGFQILSDPTLPERGEPLFEGGEATGDEVRINKSTYDFIRDKNFHSIEGLEAAFQKGQRIVFPNGSQEVKAQWVRIDEKDKGRYHWRTIRNPKGESETWGLSGLHIITRDLPNWFWCDFEHADFLPIAEMPADDPTTRGESAPFKGSKDGIRKETDGTKWQNYRLRGVQTDFADSRGFPTVVANTQIEKGFQQTSSCITCHARATVGLRGSDPAANKFRTYSLPVFEEIVPTSRPDSPILVGAIGYPNRRWYTDERGRPKFLQTDFLWSMPFRANSETETPPTNPNP